MYGDLTNYEYLGVFDNTSNKFFVSDPCYTKKTWCTGTVPAKKGLYHSFAMFVQTDWHTRIAALIVIHDSHLKDFNFDKKKKHRFSVGVDSGLAGIWDFDAFRDKLINYDYNQVCFVTSGGEWRNEAESDSYIDMDEAGKIDGYHELHPMAGVMQYGAVSRAGFGDGSYTCYTSADKLGSWTMLKYLDKEDIEKVISWKDYVANVAKKRKKRKKEDDERFKAYLTIRDVIDNYKEKQV